MRALQPRMQRSEGTGGLIGLYVFPPVAAGPNTKEVDHAD